MTNREFLNAVILANIADDVTAFAKAELDKIDAKNTKRRTTPTKNQQANELLEAVIYKTMKDNPETVYTASAIATILDVSTQKASAILRLMEKSKMLTVTEVKNEKKNKVKGYSLNIDKNDAPESDESESEKSETSD